MDKLLKILILNFVFILQLNVQGFAQSNPDESGELGFEDAVFPEVGISARALAMGNAFIAKVDDPDAAFYNPAGLGSVRNFRLHLFNFHAEMNRGLMRMTTGGRVNDIGTNFSAGLNLAKLREVSLENRGKLSHQRLHFMPNMTFRFFSIGFLYSRQTRGYLGTDVDYDDFEFAERTDMGPYAALNISLFSGIFKAGVSAMLLNRDQVISTSSPSLDFEIDEDDQKSGSMLFLTAGARLTLPYALLPTFAVTSHNAGGGSFDGGDAAPPNIKQTLDVGFSLTPQIGKIMRIHLEVNYKDVAGAYSGVASTRKLGLGIEIDIARAVFFRGGYGDGFGSGGVGIKGRNFQFDLTTYAVDTSTSDFRGAEDRRWVLSLSSGI